MGKRWRFYLGCVLKPKPNENKKKKKTRKSQGLLSNQKNEEFDFSEEVDIPILHPALPSPKPEVVLATDGYSVIEPENKNAKDAHSASKHPKDDRAKERYSMVEVENVDASNADSVAKYVDDQATDGYSMIEVEDEDVNSPHSTAKHVEDVQEEDRFSVTEDVNNPHPATRNVDDNQEIHGYSVIEAEIEDDKNPDSAMKDETYQATNKYSVIEVENGDARTSNSDANGSNSQTMDGYSAVMKDADDHQAADGYSGIEAEKQDAMDAHSAAKDADDDHTTCEYSVIEADNEDARNSYFVAKYAEDDRSIVGYSMIDPENGDTKNAHYGAKVVKDDHATDEYFVIEAAKENARISHSVVEGAENDQQKHASSTTLTFVEVAEVDVPHAQEDAKLIWLSNIASTSVNSKEEAATLKIQSVFRGYLARKSFLDVKGITGLMRLQTMVQAQFVKHQTTTTLKCMQTMARVQHQVGARRIRMYEENQALQRQLQQKHDLYKSKSNTREDWIDSSQTKEKIEANRQREQQAAIRRERELAYAYIHQLTWKSSPKQATQAFTELDNPQWDWNWLGKRMGERPWDNMTIKEEQNSKPPSSKSVTTLAQKVSSNLHLDHLKPSPTPKKKPRAPENLSISSPQTTLKSAPAGRVRVPNSPLRSAHSVDGDDTRSMQRVQSEHHRRHIGTGSSTRDYENYASPRFMSPTTSAKAKSRLRI